MSEEANVSSGDGQEPSGGSEEQGRSSEDKGKSEETVSYRSYQKLLTEKKNLSERMKSTEEKLTELLSEKKESEEKDLQAQSKYKELYEKTKEELNEQQGNYKSLITDIDRQRKVAAFLGAVGGSVDREYHVFIETDSILSDPESGEIDEMSVTKEVERFVKKHPMLVHRAHDKKTTSVYPQGESSLDKKIHYEEWKKLPAKEMAKWRHNQIID